MLKTLVMLRTLFFHSHSPTTPALSPVTATVVRPSPERVGSVYKELIELPAWIEEPTIEVRGDKALKVTVSQITMLLFKFLLPLPLPLPLPLLLLLLLLLLPLLIPPPLLLPMRPVVRTW